MFIDNFHETTGVAKRIVLSILIVLYSNAKETVHTSYSWYKVVEEVVSLRCTLGMLAEYALLKTIMRFQQSLFIKELCAHILKQYY